MDELAREEEEANKRTEKDGWRSDLLSCLYVRAGKKERERKRKRKRESENRCDPNANVADFLTRKRESTERCVQRGKKMEETFFFFFLVLLFVADLIKARLHMDTG